jgi:hypothetical protein
MFLNAENRISVDGLKIAYTRGCCEVRGWCRVRQTSGEYVPTYAGFVHADTVCMPVYPSNLCGSSVALDGQNRWLFRAQTTKYVDPARYYEANVEALLYQLINCRSGKMAHWGHGIGVAASRQGFLALLSQPGEGTTVRVSTGPQTQTYEFDMTANPSPPRIRVQIGSNVSGTAANLRAAIAANQADTTVYPSVVDSSDGYKMVLLTNNAAGEAIPVSTTVPDAVAEPLSERKVFYDWLAGSVFPLADACEGQIRVLQ